MVSETVLSKMTPLQFCEWYCGELTFEQKIMVETVVKKGTFKGVGRAVGRMVYMPLLTIGSTYNIIDKAGYYQLSAIDGRIGFTGNF